MKGRPALKASDKLRPITILISRELEESLKADAALEGRPLSEIARRRLMGFWTKKGTKA